MKKKASTRVSVRDVARAAGISKAAAGFALQNKPEVSRATRERVLRIARKLGYAPDPRLATWMARVREAKAKEFQPIAWLNAHAEKDAWHQHKFLSPYLEGAQNRALQLGYRIDEFWINQPGMTMRRMSQILDRQGIEGVIITHPARHSRLEWDHLAAVSLEGSMRIPLLHRVTTDVFSNFLLVMKKLRRGGYDHIGVCLDARLDHHVHQSIGAMIRYLDTGRPKSKIIPPLLHPSDPTWRRARRLVMEWVRRYKPDVIVGHSNYLVEWVEEAGYRVPDDIGVVHLATDDDVSDWTGIFSNRRTVGTTAVELVISLIQNRQFGVPKVALNTSIQGTWHEGRTLRNHPTK